MSSKKPKTVVGKTMCFDLPDLGLENLVGKVDTGAQNSCLHCQKIWEFQHHDGRQELYVELKGKGLPRRIVTFQKYSRTVVRSSFGDIESRYKTKLRVNAYGRTFQTDFSFSDRSHMTYSILLGRSFLRGRFLVDVSLD